MLKALLVIAIAVGTGAAGGVIAAWVRVQLVRAGLLPPVGERRR